MAGRGPSLAHLHVRIQGARHTAASAQRNALRAVDTRLSPGVHAAVSVDGFGCAAGGTCCSCGMAGLAAWLSGCRFCIAWGYKLDQLLHVSWLLRILNFSRGVGQHPMDGLDERLVTTADLVAEQLQQARYREVVVVGFSVGSVMAVPFVKALRHRLQARPDGLQRVNLLTLGN